MFTQVGQVGEPSSRTTGFPAISASLRVSLVSYSDDGSLTGVVVPAFGDGETLGFGGCGVIMVGEATGVEEITGLAGALVFAAGEGVFVVIPSILLPHPAAITRINIIKIVRNCLVRNIIHPHRNIKTSCNHYSRR